MWACGFALCGVPASLSSTYLLYVECCGRHQVWCTHPTTHTHACTHVHPHTNTPSTLQHLTAACVNVQSCRPACCQRRNRLKALSPRNPVSIIECISVEPSWLCVPETLEHPNANSTTTALSAWQRHRVSPATNNCCRVATTQCKPPRALLLLGSAHAAASACLSTKTLHNSTQHCNAAVPCLLEPSKAKPVPSPYTCTHLWMAAACADAGGCTYLHTDPEESQAGCCAMQHCSQDR